MDSIASSARHTLSQCHLDFAPQALANTAWAFSVLLMPHVPLRDAIAAAAIRTLQRAAQTDPCTFAFQELANLAWSFATLE